MDHSNPTTPSIHLDAASLAIIDRLRGDMAPSDFLKLLLQMVDSGRVSAPREGKSSLPPSDRDSG